MTNRSPKSGQRTAICHFSLVICHFLSLRSQRLCGEIRFGCGWAALCSSVVSFILFVADNFSQSLAALLDSHLLILSKLWDCHLFGDQRGYNCPAMPLVSGTRLGPYEIAEPLGAGGMGEVYRATDTRL